MIWLGISIIISSLINYAALENAANILNLKNKK